MLFQNCVHTGSHRELGCTDKTRLPLIESLLQSGFTIMVSNTTTYIINDSPSTKSYYAYNSSVETDPKAKKTNTLLKFKHCVVDH